MEDPNLPPKGHSKNGSKKKKSRPKEKTEEQKDDNVRQQQIRRMMQDEGINIDRRKKVSEEDQRLIDDFERRHGEFLNGPAPPRKKRKGVNDASVEEKSAKRMKAELVERDKEEQDYEVTNMPGKSGGSRLSTDPKPTMKSVRKPKSADRTPPLMKDGDRGVNNSYKHSEENSTKERDLPTRRPKTSFDKLPAWQRSWIEYCKTTKGKSTAVEDYAFLHRRDTEEENAHDFARVEASVGVGRSIHPHYFWRNRRTAS